MLAIHQNGTRTISTKAPSPTTVSAFQGAISVLVPKEVAADEGDADDEERHQEDREGHAAPPPELVEGHLVRVRGEHLRRRARSPSRHDVDDVEVVDRPDEAQEDRDDDDVLQPRQGDVTEPVPRAGAVDRGG